MACKTAILLTCEHASPAIPQGLESVFESQRGVLQTHRGYDIGALEVFQTLCDQLQPQFSLAGCYTRLAIELNRSLHHPALFSELTRGLPLGEKQRLIEQIWAPFRTATQEAILRIHQETTLGVCHLSVHSFTQYWNGTCRPAEIGLLYDPARPAEKYLARQWARSINAERPAWRVRFNYPYRGTADGHTTTLRRRFPERYVGVEVELQQEWLLNQGPQEVAQVLSQTLLTFAYGT